MSSKFCPFSFFSFYVNKNSAQAGGAHHCVEDNCALWDSRYDQCSLKTACENMGGATSPQSKKPRVSDILAKIRSKKKPVEATTSGVPAATPVVAAPPTEGAVTPLTEAAVAESTTVTTAETPKTDKLKPKVDLEKLLVAPEISATNLPVVSSSQETDNGPTEKTS